MFFQNETSTGLPLGNETLLMCEAQPSPADNLLSLPEYESIIYGTTGWVLWGIVFVAISFLGCIGNVLTIIVLRSDPVISTLNILLVALAISDILAPQANALLAIAFYHLEATYGNSVNYLIFSDFLRHIVQPLGTMFTMLSSWIVTTTTLFRLIAVMFPFRARTLINRRCAVASLIVLFSFSLAFILPIYWSLVRKIKCTPDGKSVYTAFEMQITSYFMAKAYMPMIQTMCFYLPWLIALTLWLFLLRTLRQSEKNFNISFVSKDSSVIAAGSNNNNNNNNNNNTLTVNSPAGAAQAQPLLLNENTANGSSTDCSANNISNVNIEAQTSIKKKQQFTTNVQGRKKSNEEYTRAHRQSLIVNNSSSIILNSDSRISNVEIRKKSYNRITLMVVVLCFTNLICRLFTFVFIFEAIFDTYSMSKMLASHQNSNLNEEDNIDFMGGGGGSGENATSFLQQPQTARTRFPRFISYSLLLNNIFLALNHSSNIFIYIFTNPKFRKNLIALFRESFLCRLLNSKLKAKGAAANANTGHINSNKNNKQSIHFTHHNSAKSVRRDESLKNKDSFQKRGQGAIIPGVRVQAEFINSSVKIDPRPKVRCHSAEENLV